MNKVLNQDYVVETSAGNDLCFKVSLIEDTKNFTYGFNCQRIVNNDVIYEAIAEAVTDEYDFALKIMLHLIKGKITPISLFDAIDDFITQSEMVI